MTDIVHVTNYYIVLCKLTLWSDNAGYDVRLSPGDRSTT